MAGNIPYHVMEVSSTPLDDDDPEARDRVQRTIQASADRAAALNADVSDSANKYKMAPNLLSVGQPRRAGAASNATAKLTSGTAAGASTDYDQSKEGLMGLRVIRASAAALPPEAVLDTTGEHSPCC
jgi:hypothetical protein